WLGDVAEPDIVGLQRSSSRETIKTRSVTRTSTKMQTLRLQDFLRRKSNLFIASAGCRAFSEKSGAAAESHVRVRQKPDTGDLPGREEGPPASHVPATAGRFAAEEKYRRVPERAPGRRWPPLFLHHRRCAFLDYPVAGSVRVDVFRRPVTR